MNAVFRKEFIAVNAYIKKYWPLISYLHFHFKKSEKEEEIKPKSEEGRKHKDGGHI